MVAAGRETCTQFSTSFTFRGFQKSDCYLGYCKNTFSYFCSCYDGYRSADGGPCADINECVESKPCDSDLVRIILYSSDADLGFEPKHSTSRGEIAMRYSPALTGNNLPWN